MLKVEWPTETSAMTCLFFFWLVDAAVCREVHGEAAKPVAAFVLLVFDGGEACLAVGLCCFFDDGDAGVFFGQARRDAFEHPCPRQIQAVEVHEVAVGFVGDDGRREPVVVCGGGEFGKEAAQPCGEFRWREDAAHEVRFRDDGGEEIVA